MNDILNRISEIGILPVIKLSKVENAEKLAESLVKGNLPAAEVTYRVEGADKVIKSMLNRYPDMLVGAGTVLTVKQAESAIASGAKFIVSPGFDEEVVDYCLEKNTPIFPGCVTPTEIQRALKKGLNIIKFFPSKQFGGLEMMNSLVGPFPSIRFMPTGGINLDNLELYISNKNIIACGGTFMVADMYVESEDWTKITNLCAKAVDIVKNVRRK